MGRLTALKIKAATKPGRYQDGDGLMLLVKPSGARSWVLRIQRAGKRREIGLGSLKDVTLAEARENAFEFRKMVRQGEDPILLKHRLQKALNAVPAFEDAARKTYAEHAPSWRNAKHKAQWISSLEA